jgi:S-adenosylmethionine hydrolase
MPRPVITLTTDFGYADGYVGAMKGVILRICPEAELVDIAHDIPAQAVSQAAYVLSTAAPYFPAGCIHLVVVDPGVGSQRRPIAVQAERAAYIAPDNGVLSLVLRQDPPRWAVHLTNPSYHLSPTSPTFHGRDVFAPVAAYLAAGADLDEVGEPFAPPGLAILPTSEPVQQPDSSWYGEIVHIDRFGNLITNLRIPDSFAQAPAHGAHLTFVVGSATIQGLSRTFADVDPGEPVVYAGSSGYLEIGLRNGSAAASLGARTGSPVHVVASGRP